MKKPSLEEVKEYFKNAETVKCLSDNDVYYINFENEIENAWDYGIYLNECKDLKGSVDQCMLWKKGQGYAEIITHKEPKEETFVISRGQIRRLYDMADIQKMTLFKDEIKLLFPSAFVEDKKELVAGKWYKMPEYKKFLGFVTKIESDRFWFYGFNTGGIYRESDFYGIDEFLIEATEQEVEEALKAEGKLKGYDNTNTLVKSLIFDNRTFNLSKSGYDQTGYRLEKTGEFIYNGVTIMKNGKWAEIIQPKKMTQAEIETELGYNIEIV